MLLVDRYNFKKFTMCLITHLPIFKQAVLELIKQVVNTDILEPSHYQIKIKD